MNILQMVRNASKEEAIVKQKIRKIRIKEPLSSSGGSRGDNGKIKLPSSSIKVQKVTIFNDVLNPDVTLQTFSNVTVGKFYNIDSEIYDEDIKIIS